ncbi:Energy-coupling factor transporter ATP-binding protein EcfA1 [Spiroplasma sp. JKS002669]|uniref:energy-coupling factor transporter ATPase n=1 Tax=Spiroplasma attinicola TaxID=2904537 RepID=UPI0020230DA9|nr:MULTISPECIES: energy-coupling factor transporter ATPase [unclassified Spiroplasma]MCL6428952.1 Energy-coupling factor transporter ATP-binding protein EcfA1 [Spiroplasma sp. JKS002669]MCL8210556.1 Energy-coupling factor transporter ATP-binding protein EcfA1 [Spiroplasma sp. JKS002671]
MSQNNISLKLNNVSYRYKPDYPNAIDDVSFSINQGEYVTIIGHNGSGKSTLSKIIMGVLHNQKGDIEIFDQKVTNKNIKKIRKHLGIVFQNPDNQFIGATVRDDIAFGLENHLVDPKKMPAIVEKAARTVGMEKYLDHEPLWLSGGQKQRVAIASVLALQPDIIIFDEATSMLDPKGKSEVKEIILQLKAERKKTIISITHDMDEILNADKVIVMNRGKLVRFDTPDEILKDWEYLQSIRLDIPFVLKLVLGLQERGVKVAKTLDEKELIANLCRLNSKK